MWTPLLLVLTALAPLIYAVPLGRNGNGDNHIPKYNWRKLQEHCDLSDAKLPVVPGINFTTSDRPKHLRALGLGVGVQGPMVLSGLSLSFSTCHASTPPVPSIPFPQSL